MTSFSQALAIQTYREGEVAGAQDEVVVEEPLELRLAGLGPARPIALTMRTPGHDRELALGYLLSEGAIERVDDVAALDVWAEEGRVQPNILQVRLREGRALPRTLERHTFTSSACGVCGAGQVERLLLHARPARWTAPPLDLDWVCGLPEQLRAQQTVFQRTGGLHAAALFSAEGELRCVREDVGRHNAVDKVVGWALQHLSLPLSDHLLLVSSRAGYEIAQKAAVAGIPVLCAVSAPTSLAVEVAHSFGLTLLGFVRPGRANVYAGAGRVALSH